MIIRREVRSLILTRRIASCLVIIVAQLVVQRWSNPKAWVFLGPNVGLFQEETLGNVALLFTFKFLLPLYVAPSGLAASGKIRYNLTED